MKHYICLALMLMAACRAMAQTNLPVYKWSATMKVVDEDGNPISAANAEIGYYTDSKPVEARGLTDTSGLFETSHGALSSMVQISLKADKAGYYPTLVRRELGPQYDFTQWNFTQVLVLKKIGNPIQMYARKAQIELPASDSPVGFDLIESDWVSPFGKGKQSDILFETRRRWVSRRDFDSSVKIAFPNKGDGVVIATDSVIEGSSGPRLRTTIDSGNYLPEIERALSNTPGVGWKSSSTNQNYYLRVRTVINQNGNVVSALYGKIYGDFTLDPINSKTLLILFTYYLNPTPNDQNLEFDPSKNFFESLPILQQVKDP